MITSRFIFLKRKNKKYLNDYKNKEKEFSRKENSIELFFSKNYYEKKCLIEKINIYLFYNFSNISLSIEIFI